MALFNYATRELSAKIVYYGPGLSGKTTNIEMVHHLLRPDQKGRLISLPTETDRTLFFDFLPVDLGQIKGFKVRFHLYTVPGQVFYNATRRLVLQGVDGVVFVADSQVDMMSSNLESLKNLQDNLATYGKKIEELPFVMQYNKRDLKNISSTGEMDAQLNDRNVPIFEGIAKDGMGVTETLVAISRLVFSHLRKSLLLPGDTAEEAEIGVIADMPGEKTSPAEAAEQLEEISEFEEIPEVQEIPETTEIPEGVELIIPPREVSPEPFPQEVSSGEDDAREERPVEEIPSSPAGDLPEEIEVEIPGTLDEPPTEKATLPGEPMTGEGESLSSPEPAAEESPSPLSDLSEEIEIEIPGTFDESPPAQATRTGVSMEVEGEGLTFLKFEDLYVSSEGHAVLPAVFHDAEGNPVRIRIRVSLEKGRE
jgi:signal recognition particle receptor subunit beta